MQVAKDDNTVHNCFPISVRQVSTSGVRQVSTIIIRTPETTNSKYVTIYETFEAGIKPIHSAAPSADFGEHSINIPRCAIRRAHDITKMDMPKPLYADSNGNCHVEQSTEDRRGMIRVHIRRSGIRFEPVTVSRAVSRAV